eukprot:TRINITY_DN22608_c0_g1_i1.p2 TRINITY_DN22608_c0_g1~~TRINITY_DN22608_c0_g1_i1.p2  ORF type:complete len:283 (+),score=93.33 TRINITY_DN22608_c0_g1_i1:350-1198(+)
MALRPTFACEDKWEEFLEKTDPKKCTRHVCGRYSWKAGRAEDDEGFMRECVDLEVPVALDVEPKQIRAKLKPGTLELSVAGQEVINDSFADSGWLSVEDSYWELETRKAAGGERRKFMRYFLYLRADCDKYITDALFAAERARAAEAATAAPAAASPAEGAVALADDAADSALADVATADARIRAAAELREEEPHRDDDVYFSEDDEFSDYECEGCGSKSVKVIKKAEEREFKVYCDDCPHVSKADLVREARSIRRQKEVAAARAAKAERKRQEAESAAAAV